MEANQISIMMDTKLDVHDKLKFKQWTKCQIKIEAVKCLPCFLRITFKPTFRVENEYESPAKANNESVSVFINVPGVNISLATSRTRQHSFGVFWTQNRKKCYIYFAPETELTCKRLMKWMKKSIKNLELYRQIVLEQRRTSRGPTQGQVKKHATEMKTLQALTMDSICSYTSGIYEEIPDHETARDSRASIASGIYEEMKPPTSQSATTKPKTVDVAPPLPPLPPQRKRINTFESNMRLGELPRCNTNPESEAIKKKKYKNMFDNLFGVTRTKRAESVSEAQASTIDEVINCATPKRTQVVTKIDKQLTLVQDKRNSFSSPDLSKINLLQFDENDGNSFSICQDLTFGKEATETIVSKEVTKMRRESLNSLNVSAQIPFNFNFSACNTSKINLVGANVANAANETTKIPIDDLTGYCLMAPIMPEIKIDKSALSNSSNKTEDSAVYVNMNNSALENCISPSLVSGSHFNQHLYENLKSCKPTQEFKTLTVLNVQELSTSTPTDVGATLQTVEEENFYQTPRKSIISVDEKIPSYYPNDNVKCRRSSRSPLKERIMCAGINEALPSVDEVKPEIPVKQRHKLKRQEHVKGSPLRNTEGEKQMSPLKTIKVKKTTTARRSKSNGRDKKEEKKKLQEKMNVDLLQLSALPKIDFKFDDVKVLVSNNNNEPKLEEEAEETILRSPTEKNIPRSARAASTNTPERYKIEQNKDRLEETASNMKHIMGSEGYAAHFMQMAGFKKYASLPRLKKIDFSPLKMKINNVLQRQFTPPREIEQELTLPTN